MDIKIDKRVARVEFLEQNGDLMKIRVDKKIYEVDVVMVEDMVYSLLFEGLSYNIEMIQGAKPYKYSVNTLYNSYQVEVLDQANKLKLGKTLDYHGDADHIITPMPAKIVKILVKEGETVKKGQVLIIVSAMKMEIEHKSPKDCKIKKIKVKEEETVNVNDVLIELT
ncbi:MAG: biotin/lipoyl-binding protein [Bacteroidetes bacterium]|nr:biotin/lipoyl-binding protein [Bacteroidota bacterium]